MNPNGPIGTPDLRAVLLALRDEFFSSLNCHQVGAIVAYDKAKQTARVALSVKRVVYNLPQEGGKLQQTPRIYEYPVLVDVPVFVLSGGNARVNVPIAPGDPCLVLFNDRDLDAWYATGATTTPNSSRMHDLSDGLALVGFRSRANALAGMQDDRISLDLADAQVAAKADGTAEITGAEGAKVAAGGKVEIANGGENLKNTLDALMDALTGWINTGGSTPNPATVLALTAVKTRLDALLQ